MSDFSRLKTLGMKQIGFKQSKCIDNELRNDSDTDLGIRSARDGMCYVFSLAYIQDFLAAEPVINDLSGRRKIVGFKVMNQAGHTPSGYSRMAGTIDEAATVLVRAAIDANLRYDTAHQRLKNKEITIEKLTSKMAKYFGLTVATRPPNTWGLKNMLQVVDAMAPHAKAQVWELGLYLKEGAHAVVLARRTGAYFFFDPNVGGYRVERKNIRTFLSCWEDACISEFGEDWAIELISVTAFAITPPPGETPWTEAILNTAIDKL